ncbi:TATA-binding protein-associated factor TAF6 [Sporobolomyces koalae]|uniref:TATA-binding protein-associated factor TAF6 n=1 Tax=Sporobolomyces koalae TaxID=500713 RepID=UPI00317108F1
MARPTATSVSGVWKKDSVKDVAETLGIANLPEEVAAALAGDVEYRLWELIEESIKFMRHSRRTRLKVEDVDHALKVRNLEPLWGFTSGTQHLPFKKTVTASGTVYHVEDEEVDLTKIIKPELPAVPRDISFTAHWLAIEGVQPLIKENPTPAELAKFAPRASTASLISSASSSQHPNSSITPLVKHVLSRELQLYFTRLTEALGSSSSSADSVAAPNSEVREAALGSVRNDPGLHQLVPYLIAWAGEQIANHLDDLPSLQRALDLFHAMLENPTLFVEPYLHQLTPPILTCLLTSSLPSAASPDVYPSPLTIRTLAASLLHLVLERHSYAYPSLLPRITKTLLRGLAGDQRGLGSRWGAARGLSGIVVGRVGMEPAKAARAGTLEGEGQGGGNRAIRDWIGNGLKTLGEMLTSEPESFEGEREEVVREIYNVLRASLLPETPSSRTGPDPTNDLVQLRSELEERYGKLFGDKVLEMWERGGRQIYETVNNPANERAQQEQAVTEAPAQVELEAGQQNEEDDDDEDDDERETETREGSLMEE